MAPAESATAILHMSAVVSVLTFTYLGIDRLDPGTEKLDEDFKLVKSRAESYVQQLGIRESGGQNLSPEKWKTSDTIYPTCVMCLVADLPVALSTKDSFFFFFYKQKKIPFLTYFSKHVHLFVVSMLSFIASIIFLSISAMIVWDYPLVHNETLLRVLYVLLSLEFAWVVLTAALSVFVRPKRLINLCERLHVDIEKNLQDVLESAQRTVDAFRKDSPGAAGGPSAKP